MKKITRGLIWSILFCVMAGSTGEAAAPEKISVQNCGTPGANTYESLTHLHRLLAGKADHLVIFLGMNDAMNSSKLVGVKEYKKNLAAMISAAKKAGIKSVLLLTIHPVITDYLIERHPGHPHRKRLQEHLDEYNTAIRELAQETCSILVDWRARFLAESPGNSPASAVENQAGCLLRCEANSGARDGVHLTAKGYRFLADEVARVLRDRIKKDEIVLCFGDSITFGSHMKGQGSATGKTYPAFLHIALSPEGIKNSEKPNSPQSERLAHFAPPGWTVVIELPDGKQTRITNTTKSLSPKVTKDKKSGDTRLVWDGLGSGPLRKLTLQMTGKQLSTGAAWQLNIQNRGKASVWKVTIPRPVISGRQRRYGGHPFCQWPFA